MDFHGQQNYQQPVSHLEAPIVLLSENALIEQVKQTSFWAMDRLEGWCSKNKAAVLIDLTFMLKPKTVVEIGVFGGKSLVPMAYALKFTESGMIYGIDPWASSASTQGMDGANFDWWNTVDHGKILRDLQIKISEFGLSDQITLIKATSKDAPSIPNIDILHIDGNHSEENAMLDVKKWVPLVRKGGVIIFDDVTWRTGNSADDPAVQWLDKHCTRLVEFHDSSDWAIWIKS